MRVHSQAPVRVDFAGGWSDVPDFVDNESGAVANAAIDLHAYVEVSTGGGVIRVRAEDIGQRVVLSSPVDLCYDGKLDLHKAALNMLPVTGGLEIVSRSDVPAGSGLGASGSLDVALVAALSACRGQEIEPTELAELGFFLEAGELKLEGGRQDQYAAALGGFLELGFNKGSSTEVRRLEISVDQAKDLESHMLVVYTGKSHFSSETHRRVWKAYHDGNADVAEAIKSMRDLVSPVAGALQSADWRELGRLIDENWKQQQRLDPTIATDTMEQIERAAREIGAWGVKATGAGAGGCMIAIAPPDARSALAKTAADGGAQVLDWSFEFQGVQWRADADAGSDRE